MMATAEQNQVAASKKRAIALRPPRLPWIDQLEDRFGDMGVNKTTWYALVEAVFPLAQSVESVILALSYCKGRRLDPFKRNVHIVPIWNSTLGRMVDTIWPGIGELRTTAFRTGQYAGREATEFGPNITKHVGTLEIEFPEWAQVTVYRMVLGQRMAFAGPRVYWMETYSTAKRGDMTPNAMWSKRTRGQLDKCAEAAALRAAFPEEIGNEYIDAEAHVPEHYNTIETTATPKRVTRSQLNDQLESAAQLDSDDAGSGAAEYGDSDGTFEEPTVTRYAEHEALIRSCDTEAQVSYQRREVDQDVANGHLTADEGQRLAALCGEAVEELRRAEPETTPPDSSEPSELAAQFAEQIERHRASKARLADVKGNLLASRGQLSADEYDTLIAAVDAAIAECGKGKK